MNYGNIPEELRRLNRWVCWKLENRNGKQTKIPINPKTGGQAMSNNPSTWTDFITAMRKSTGYSGIGFMFNGDGIVGIDLDHVYENGKLTEEAKDIISTLNSYTEFSQSKTGIHVICKGKLPEGKRRKGSVEMYEKARFFVMTGDVLDEVHKTIEERTLEINIVHGRYLAEEKTSTQISINLSDSEIIEKARKAKNGPEFERLYDRGDISGNNNDDSAADLALCNILAFYTQDYNTIDSIFRSSALYRTKWNEKRPGGTYGSMTIRKAIRDCGVIYSPQGKKEKTNVSNPDNKSTEIKPKQINLQSGTQLLNKDLRPLEYIIQGLLPDAGVFILGGAPKIGKSWLCLDMTLSIARKQQFFKREVKQCNVLYLDLESGERSLKARLEKLSHEDRNLDNWFFLQEIRPIGNGFVEDIEEIIKKYNTKVIVIDVFVKVRSIRLKTQNEYQHDYADITVLKDITKKYEVTFVLVTHVTKMNHDDPINKITGSVGMNGTTDGTIILLNDRLTGDSSLFVSGREIEQQDLKIEFDKDELRWKYIATKEEAQKMQEEEEYQNSLVIQVIKLLVKDKRIWKGYISDIRQKMYTDVDISKSKNPKDVLAASETEAGKYVKKTINRFSHLLYKNCIKVEIGNRTGKGFPLTIISSKYI